MMLGTSFPKYMQWCLRQRAVVERSGSSFLAGIDNVLLRRQSSNSRVSNQFLSTY